MLRAAQNPRGRHAIALRTIGSGGEALGAETYDWGKDALGLTINEFYGQTECNKILAACNAIGVSKAGAIGKPVPGHRVAVITADGTECKPGEVGQIAVQRPDPVMFLQDFADKIFHVHVKESVRQLNGRNGRLGSHLPWADPRRGWDFVTAGHGDVNWEPIFRTLNAVGYEGPTSIEWEDAGMDRLVGAPQALKMVRELAAIRPPAAAFDAAFATR